MQSSQEKIRKKQTMVNRALHKKTKDRRTKVHVASFNTSR